MARFQCATWRPISANMGGPLGPNLGLILHQQVGEGSLYGFFDNPAAQVSAHFWVSKKGTIEQYVDTSVVAWHGRDLNGTYVGVETEGCANGPEPLTQAQVDALGRVYAEGMRVHAWPNALCEGAGQKGFGYHRMPGGVNTQCPYQVRVDQRDDVLRAAAGAPPPPPAAGGFPRTPPPYPGRLLEVGVSGEDVRTWQQTMGERKWQLAVDGAYGPESERVCTQFQRNKGLAVDGVVGPETWAATWSTPVG